MPDLVGVFHRIAPVPASSAYMVAGRPSPTKTRPPFTAALDAFQLLPNGVCQIKRPSAMLTAHSSGVGGAVIVGCQDR